MLQYSSTILSEGQNLTESFQSPQTLDSPSSNAATLDNAPRSLTGSGEIGPDLNIPEPHSSTVLPSVDATVTQTPPVESAAASSPGIVDSAGTGRDFPQGAGESVGNPAELTPLQRYEDLINRAKGGGGARKPVAVEEDVTSFSFPNSIEAAQESVTKTIADTQDAINDSIESAGKAIRDVYESINGSIKGSVDSVTGSIKGSVDSVTGSIKGSVDSVTGSIKGSVNSVTGLFDKTLDDVQTSVGNSVSTAGREVPDLTSIFRTGTPLNNQLKEVVVVVKGATSTALEAAGKVLTDVYGTARVNLPPEVQSSLSVAEQKVQGISEPLGSFLQQVGGSFALEDFRRGFK